MANLSLDNITALINYYIKINGKSEIGAYSLIQLPNGKYDFYDWRLTDLAQPSLQTLKTLFTKQDIDNYIRKKKINQNIFKLQKIDDLSDIDNPVEGMVVLNNSKITYYTSAGWTI